MKKLLFTLVLLLSSSSLLGCSSSSKERLTFGTLYHESAVEVTTDEVYTKKENENFLLATYGDTTCGCWVYFSRVLDHIAKYDHLLTYKLSNDNIDERLNEYGIKDSDNPAFYIIANKKIVQKTFYVDNDSIFADENKLLEAIKEKIDLPYMYLINEEQIQSEVVNKGGVIYYSRMSCPDCSYCNPNLLMPYFKNRGELTDKIYVCDMDPLRKEDPDKYQEFKDDHFLSNKYNSALGYNTGYVPTFQYYKNGGLIDMAVYFNDEVEGGLITTSYYDQERLNHIHYADKLTKKVLTGTRLEVYEISSKGSWLNNEVHNSYYRPFLEAFFDLYLK